MTPGPNKNTGAKSGKSGPVDQNYNSAYNCSLLSQKAYDPIRQKRKTPLLSVPNTPKKGPEASATIVIYIVVAHSATGVRIL